MSQRFLHLGLFLALLGTSACLIAPVSTQPVELHLKLPLSALKPKPLAGPYRAPTDISGMSCFFLSVTGPGVPAQTAGTKAPPACLGVGLISSFVSGTTLGTPGAKMRVPAGRNRRVRIVGIVPPTGFTTPVDCAAKTSLFDFALNQVKPELYVIADTTVDLFRDKVVTVNNDYKQTSATDLTAQCPSGSLQLNATPNNSLVLGSTITLSASGGTAPYTYSLVSGSVTVTPAGLVNRPSWTTGQSTVKVTDSAGRSAQLAIDCPASVVNLGQGTVAAPTPVGGALFNTSNAMVLAGSTTASLWTHAPSPAAHGSIDAYLAVIPPDATSPQFIQLGGGGTSDTLVTKHFVNSVGAVIVGTTQGTLVSSVTGTHGITDLFLSAHNPTDATLTWIKQLGGGSTSSTTPATTGFYSVDGAGNSYLLGNSTVGSPASLQLGHSPPTLGNTNAFFFKYDSSGAALYDFGLVPTSGYDFTAVDFDVVPGSTDTVVIFGSATFPFSYPVPTLDGNVTTPNQSLSFLSLSVSNLVPAGITQTLLVGSNTSPSATGIQFTPRKLIHDVSGLKYYALTEVVDPAGLQVGSTTPTLLSTNGTGGTDTLIVAVADTLGSVSWKMQIQAGSGKSAVPHVTSFVQPSSTALLVRGKTNAALTGATAQGIAGNISDFIASIDPSTASLNWFYELGPGAGKTANPTGIAYDANYIYLTGHSDGTDFGGATQLNPAGGGTSNLYVARLTYAGALSTVLLGAPGTNTYTKGDPILDGSNGLLVQGTTDGDLPLSPTGTPGGSDLFVARFDMSGASPSLSWVFQLKAGKHLVSGIPLASTLSGLFVQSGFAYVSGTSERSFLGPVFGSKIAGGRMLTAKIDVSNGKQQ